LEFIRHIHQSKRITVVGQLNDSHRIAVALLTGISAIPVDSTLTRVSVVVCVGTGPKVTLSSIAIVPPRLDDAVQFKRCAETVVLMADDELMMRNRTTSKKY